MCKTARKLFQEAVTNLGQFLKHIENYEMNLIEICRLASLKVLAQVNWNRSTR